MKPIRLISTLASLIVGFAAVCPAASSAETAAVAMVAWPLEKHNVVWDSPSPDSKGSMPIGNGDIGLNVWVEPSGDLCFYIGKTDAWDENIRLLKLNKVRIKFTPALDTKNNFRWELKLHDGRIEIQDAAMNIRVWVDANNPVIQVDVRSLSGQPVAASATLEPWRKEKRAIPRQSMEFHSTGFTSLPAFSYPDTLVPRTPRQIAWYHRNVVSPWSASLKLQKLEAVAIDQKDPLFNRTTGGIVRGENFAPVSDSEIKTIVPAAKLSLGIHVLTQVTDTPDEWLSALEKQAGAAESLSAAMREQAHAQWWNAFWNRSWVFIEKSHASEAKPAAPSSPADIVTRGYTLQRWVSACSGRGASPIKFNGSIFTVDVNGPVCGKEQHYDADFRLWGGGYWWQNTRLPYWAMLSSGDFEMMRPLFDMYMKALPMRKLATKTYYGHNGAFFPETMTFFGTYLDDADLGYGIDRNNKPDGLTDNQYIRRYWQSGIEMIALMLDYYDLTQDADFRDHTLIPYSSEIITFFDEHWKRNPDGKIHFHPAQSLETWWNCLNPLPEIAGLRHVIPRLHAITGTRTWQKTLDALPPVPMSADGKRLVPAEKVMSRASNVENTEMYGVFPYRLHTMLSDDANLEIGRNTFAACRVTETFGWHQTSIQSALLGLSNKARSIVSGNAAVHAPGFRFPACWGPNYDWMPDQDHGSVIMATLQRMVMQCEGDKILLLPAWPKNWDVNFKLHAPKQTTIECQVKNGKIVKLAVTPESRRKDVVIAEPPPAPISEEREATCSASFGGNSPLYDADKAFDGEADTRWAAADPNRSWLAVDLGSPTAVSRAVIDEGNWNRVREFSLEYLSGSEWKPLATGTTIGPKREFKFPPVTAQKFRLDILQSSGQPPCIHEMQLFNTPAGSPQPPPASNNPKEIKP